MYLNIFIEKTQIIKKHHPDKELTKDKLCQMVKDGKMTMEDFKHVDKEHRVIVKNCLKFIADDRNGHR